MKLKPRPSPPITAAMEAHDPLVLVAEDDPDIRALIRNRVQHAGFRVAVAASGDEALELARTLRPDVLLLDVGLPVLDGFEVCRVLNQDPGTAPAVIFLTARTTTDERVRGLGVGAVDYIAKPFEAAELVARIQAALRTKQLVDGLARRASTDALTGLLNRDELDRRLVEHVALARRGRPLACLMLDIDHFKLLNDRYGHVAGDEVLREVARRLQRANVRSSDLSFRYGGEEFLLLLPDTGLEGASVAAEKVLNGVASRPVELSPGLEVGIGLSIGAAVWSATMSGPAELVAAADEALYEAKRTGRGRVAVVSC